MNAAAGQTVNLVEGGPRSTRGGRIPTPAPMLLRGGFIHASAWNKRSRKFISKILHVPAPIPLESPVSGAPHCPAPAELVTAMDGYAELWMRSLCKHLFAVAIIPEGRSDPSTHS